MPHTDVYFNDGSDRHLDRSVHRRNGCDREIGQGDGGSIEPTRPDSGRLQAMLPTLTDIDRQVLTALAIFGEPVPDTAVAFLLHPHLEGIQTKLVLDKLHGLRVIGRDRGGYYVPP